jgi:DNA modification methylase
MNQLYYGDNLTIMQKMPKSSVDLIYLDPPFNSKKNYNIMYKNMTGKPVPEQVDAFCDTWELDAEKEETAKAMPVLMREHGVEDYYVQFWRLWIQALRHTQPHLLAYLIYMVQRLLHMKTILRSSGSLYLHCDPTASHYIKVMLDGIFGHNNFRNEVIWKRTSSHSSAKRWGPVHDVILFYTKSDDYTWNRVAQAYDKSYIKDFYRHEDSEGRFRLGDLTGAGTRTGDSGKPWKDVDPTTSGRHWAVPAVPGLSPAEIKAMTVQERLDALDDLGLIYWPEKGSIPQFRRYLDPLKGVAIQDVVGDIDPISPHAKERLGYPTQKPLALLDRIISASSNEGDVIFDPFCGCGTTIYSAEKNRRGWVGCDIAILSIRLMRDVLTAKYQLTEGKHFEVSGIPVSVEQAEELFKRDPFQFQHWLVERAGGFPMQKKVADRGIDGRIYFETIGNGLKEMVLSVKGGNIRPTDIRDLRGTLEREEAACMAGFLSLKEPTRAMKADAAQAGVYRYKDVAYDRIQFLTVADILENKREFHTPSKLGAKLPVGQGKLAL